MNEILQALINESQIIENNHYMDPFISSLITSGIAGAALSITIYTCLIDHKDGDHKRTFISTAYKMLAAGTIFALSSIFTLGYIIHFQGRIWLLVLSLALLIAGLSSILLTVRPLLFYLIHLQHEVNESEVMLNEAARRTGLTGEEVARKKKA